MECCDIEDGLQKDSFIMNFLNPTSFNPRYHANDPELQALFDTFPAEFQESATFHEYIGDWWFAVSGTDNPSQKSYLLSLHAKEPAQVYKTPVAIWFDGDSYDFWCRMKFISYRGLLRIIFSDYSGIYLFDEKLQAIFSMPTSPEMVASNDVFGYHFDGESIMIWKMSKMNSLNGASRCDKYHDISRVSEVMSIMTPF